MDEAAVRVFWPPSPPAHAVTSVAVDVDRAWLYTGGSDGAIVRWHLQGAVAPKAYVMLVGHTRPIRHLAPGLKATGPGPGSEEGRYLLSVDDGGGCCLWREPCGRCVLQRWIPEMGVAVFGQLPADRSGPFASSNWLLAALPAVGGGELALRPHPHPPHHHHQHHYQANHHDQQPYAPTPSLLHGVRYSGPGCLAGGGGGGGDGPGEMTALHDNAMKSSRGPVLLVIDWRSLSLFKALDMQPLQQLVCVDMPTAAYKFRFTSSGSHGGGSGGSSGGGASSPTSQQRAVRPPWTECKSGGGSCDSPDPSSVLLCLQWGPCAVPFGHGVGVGNSGSTDSSSYTGGPGRDTMVVVALALTPTGTLYGCVVPYDPYKPPAWVLGCGGARNTPDGGVVGEGGFAGGGARCVGSEQLPGREGQEEPLRPQMEVREPLLSAAVSTNLRWALLGALDSLIVLEARWNAVQSLAAKSMSAKAISTPTPLSGAGVHNVPPRLLQLSYTAKCRISLMHQPGAGMLAVSAGPTVLNRQQSPPSQRSCARQLPRRPGMQGGPCSGGSSGSGSGSGSSAECSTYGTDPQEPEGVSSGRSLRPPVVPVSGHHIHAAAARTGLAQHSHQPHVIRTAAHLLVLGTWEEEEPLTAARVKAVGEMAAAATAAELLGAAARQPHSISGMAGPATATFTTATAAAAVSATAAVTSSLEFVEAGYPRPSELEPGLSRSVLALSSPAQPPRPAAAPNTANCSDSRTSPFPRCTAAVAAVKGIDVPRPPAPVAGTALTPTAAVAVPVAGSNLDQRMADYDDELLTKSCSPDLARLSFAVYLPPRGGGGGSAASSSVLQPPQAQSPSKGRKQQSRPQLQPQLQQPQVLLPLNGSAQVLSGAPAAMDGLHEIESGEGRCQGQAQQSHAQSPARSAPQQELQLQLPGRPSPAQEGEFSGLQVNLATAARGGHGGGGGGGGGGGSGTMAALGAHAGPQETSEKQMHQSLHGEGVGLSLTHGSARPIHHWRQRTNHHRHHHGHDASTRGAVVLQVLSWDGAGRQQVVSLTSDGRILAVQELSAAAAPPAPAAASFGTQLLEARQTGWPSCYSAPSHLADALCCATTAFCGYLPTQGGGDGVCNIGAGDGNCSGRGDVGRGDGGGLEGWVLGVHCYQGDARPATVSVLQWPLSRPHSLPYVARQASPLAAEAAAAIRAVSSSGRERSLAEANLVPLVGSLHDGWAAAAAVTWRAHTARRRRRRRAMLRHGCGRAGGGAAAAAQADHGSVWDFACEEGTDGGCSVRGTVRQYGGYEAVRDGRSDGRGSADAVADDDNGLLPDSEVIRVRRRIDVGKVTKRYCSGNGFAATSAAAATTTIAGDGNSLYGPPASPDVPCRHGGGGRIRRDSSGGGAQRGLPACLYERWDAGQKCIPWSNGKRDCTAQPQDVLAVVRAGNEGVDVGIGSSAPTYTSAAVVSASVLVCDGTAAGEAVVLHCMADGEMHYYDAGAYTVPSVPHCCTADGGFKHATSSLLQASVRGDDDAGHWHADNDGDGYRYDNSGGCGESFGIPVPPAVMRPGRAGSMRGHIGPVTCQLEVLVSIMPAASATAAAAAAANTASVNHPASSPSLASYAHLITGGVARASGGVAAAGDVANGNGSYAVRVLLTGGSDGSLRGWHTHAAMFGRPVFALHPHGAAVGRVLLPRGSETHAPPEFSQCVVSAAEDGSVALVCLERGCVLRVCRTYPYGMPEVVSWSFRRGFLACGGCDAVGQWTVAVFDIAPAAPSLDRIAMGSEAAAILDMGVAASTLATTSMLPSPPLLHIAPTAASVGSQTVPLQQWPHHRLHQSPHIAQVPHQGQGGLLTHQSVQRHVHHSHLPSPPVSHHHYHHNHHNNNHYHYHQNNSNHHRSQAPSQNSNVQEYQQQQQHPPPPGAQPSGPSRLASQLLGRISDGGGGGGGGGSGHRSWVHSVPLGGRSGSTAPSPSMPAPTTLVAASSSTPNLAPVWAYGGSFRTIYCRRPDVLLAAIDSEALLAKISAATRTAATAAAATASSSPRMSSPMPVPRRPGLVVARSSPCQPPYGLSQSHGIPFPPVASTTQLSVSAYPSRRASLDLGTAAAAAGSRDHMPAALPSTSAGAAAGAGLISRGGASRFSIEADRSVGGRSIGGASAGSGRLSIDEPSPVDAQHIDLSDKKALVALVSMLHPWVSDPRVDQSLEEVLVLLGILICHHDRDPWVSDGGEWDENDATVTSMACFNGAAATHDSVSWHRSHSAPEGQFAFDNEGDYRLVCNGTSSAAAGNGIGGASTGMQSATTATVKPAAGVGGLSVGCSPQGAGLPGETQPPRGHIPDPRFGAESDDEQYGDTSTGPCLVQPALVSACGSVALAMPQAPGSHGADPLVVGDPTAAAARLLHIVSLAGALGMVGEQGEPPSVAHGTVCRAAVRAASCVRHLCLVMARDAVAADRAAGVRLSPAAASLAATWQGTQAHAFTSSPSWSCPRLHEPDLAVFARRWIAPDPWVRDAARRLLSAYTKPWALDTAASAMSAPVAAAAQPPPSFPPLLLPRGEGVAAPANSAGAPGGDVGSSQPPMSVLLPSQAMQLLLLRDVVTSESSQSAGAANAAPQHSRSRRPSGTAPSQLPPPPQRLYPAAIIAAAACLAHPDAVPRQLFGAAAASLVELLCLPLTLAIRTSAGSASVGADVTDVPRIVQSAVAHQQAALQPPPTPPPQQQQQQQSNGLWVDGQVLLPEVAAAILTAALSSLAAAQWRQQLQPWARFVDRVLHLAHAIPLPPRGTRAVSHDAAVAHQAAAGAHGPMGHTPHCHYPPGSPPHAAPAATPQRAARQLADQVVKLLAAAAELDMEAMLEGMSRFGGGASLPLHPLVAAALTRLAARSPGRRCLAAAAPALGALLASCAAAPAARDRPDLARPAYLVAADLAAALPCAALHANSMQLAVGPPLAAASPSGEPQYVIVYDLEHGNATWQLPLQPGPGALQPLPTAAAGTLGTSAAAATATDPVASSRMATVVAVTGGGGVRSSLPGPASSLPEVLRGVGRGGVAALQFSPQGDHLAVLVMDGTPTPALLIYSLNLPWSHKLLMLPGAARPALVVQPCHCWLLPGLLQLIQPPPSPPLQLRQPKQQQEREEDCQRNQPEPQQQMDGAGASAWSGCAAAGEAVGAAELSPYRQPGCCAGEEEVGRKEGVGKERELGAELRNCGQMQDEGPEAGRRQEEGWQPQATLGDRDVRLVRVIDRVFRLRWSGQSCVELLRNRTAILARFVLPVGA